MGFETNTLVHLQTLRRLLAQQHSRGTVSTMAVDDPRTLRRTRCPRVSSVADRAALDLVCDRVVAANARRACRCFHSPQSCRLSRLTHAKPRARCDDNVAPRGARCGRY